jgi:transcriptional regulator with XRE-family HTH domain
MREVGAEIRRLREERGWTGAQLAVYAGMAPSAVSQIETGRRSPNTGSLSKIAKALEVEVVDLFPKGQAPLPDFDGGRRLSKLPETADLLLQFAEMLLLTWEAELPARAQADDTEWLLSIRTIWQAFGLINYGVLDELGADGVRDKEAWLARYMDINAAVHRINAAILEHSTAGASSAGEAAIMLPPPRVPARLAVA